MAILIRRIVGLLIIIIAIAGVVLSYLGLRAIRTSLGNLESGISNSLLLASQTLDNVEATLLLTRGTLVDINTGMTSVNSTLNTLSQTISDTEPLLVEVGGIAGEDVPNSLEAIQDTIPDLVQVAATIDETLTTLNDFRIDEVIPFVNVRLQYDLGVNYEPEVPFDESVERVGTSLDGMPERLREINGHLNTSINNLTTLSENLEQIATDLETTNENLEATPALIDEYVRIVNEVNVKTKISRASLEIQFDNIQRWANIFVAWIGLTQLAPFYLGLTMLFSRRPDPPAEPASTSPELQPSLYEEAPIEVGANEEFAADPRKSGNEAPPESLEGDNS